jgi:hypothetical protein
LPQISTALSPIKQETLKTHLTLTPEKVNPVSFENGTFDSFHKYKKQVKLETTWDLTLTHVRHDGNVHLREGWIKLKIQFEHSLIIKKPVYNKFIKNHPEFKPLVVEEDAQGYFITKVNKNTISSIRKLYDLLESTIKNFFLICAPSLLEKAVAPDLGLQLQEFINVLVVQYHFFVKMVFQKITPLTAFNKAIKELALYLETLIIQLPHALTIKTLQPPQQEALPKPKGKKRGKKG